MFMGSLRSSPCGSRAGDDEDEEDEEALMLGDRVGGVPGGRACSNGASLHTSLSSPSPSPDSGSLDGDAEGLRDPPGEEVGEAAATSRLERRGVRRTLLLSEDTALRLALMLRRPRPCLQDGEQGTGTAALHYNTFITIIFMMMTLLLMFLIVYYSSITLNIAQIMF